MANYYNENTIIYLDGKFVKAAESKIDLYNQSLHYGYAVFEGIRSYKTVDGTTKIFKAAEHYHRLKNSANALHIPYHFDSEVLIEATYEVLKQNNLQDAYIRTIVYGPSNMSYDINEESHIAILVWQMGAFLGHNLLRIAVSPFQRPNPKGFIITAKACGHYVNSMMASNEAKSRGFNEALLTDMNGYVAEGPGANVFFEMDGKLITPSLGNILPGITRATIFEICKDLGITVEEKFFTKEEIYGVDAAFFCGTAAEVIGWESLDGIAFKKDWNDTLSKKVQSAYKALIVANK